MNETPMPYTSSAALHPSLWKQAATWRRRIRLLGLLMFFIFGGLMMYAMVAALTSQTLEYLLTLGLMGLLMVPGVGAGMGVMWYADRWVARKLAHADRLMKGYAPQAVQIIPVRPGSGSPAVQLQKLTDQTEPVRQPVYALLSSLPRSLPAQGIAAQMYIDHQAFLLNSALVLQTPDNAVISGKIVNRKACDADFRRRRFVIIFIVVVYLLWMLLLAESKFGWCSGFFSQCPPVLQTGRTGQGS